MRPEGTRVWRKNGRVTKRGLATGRRATHHVQTTFGRKQRQAEWRVRVADLAKELT